jgi:hypothetical protein
MGVNTGTYCCVNVLVGVLRPLLVRQELIDLCVNKKPPLELLVTVADGTAYVEEADA